MIFWILQKLTGPWGYVLVGINAALVAGFGSYEARGLIDARDVAQAHIAVLTTEKTVETNRADGNAATVTAISKAVGDALSANNDLRDEALKRYAATTALIERLSHVPKTVACAGSPAIRELLRSQTGPGAAATAGNPH